MTDGWGYLSLRDGAKWPKGASGRDLLKRLNQAARDEGQHLIVVSGQRGWREQHAAYMDYLRGGTLAAPCCPRHYVHSESSCLRQCGSRHCQGRAADVVARRKDGSQGKNVADVPGMRHALRLSGLCCPVPGEPWHVEVGSTWRA